MENFWLTMMAPHPIISYLGKYLSQYQRMRYIRKNWSHSLPIEGPTKLAGVGPCTVGAFCKDVDPVVINNFINYQEYTKY